MGSKNSRTERNFAVIENVRCLECGAVYSKPAGGGTVQANPGCPDCGYLGWFATTLPLNAGPSPNRSAADRQRRRSA